MKLAVLSDVHGNVEALRAVLADLDAQGAEGIVSCGDMVGYGPDPDEAVALLRERDAAMLAGNHELGLCRCSGLGWFNPTARCALRVTAHLVAPQTVEFLGGLRKHLVLHGCRFVHGFPPDSAHTYLFAADDEKIVAALENMRQRLCFVGHTHEIALAECRDGRLRRWDPGPGRVRLDPEASCIVNVGSVGQPRDDWGKDAKYVLWDSAAQTVDFRFVPYDSAETRRKILERGLPARYAEILAER
ncbi:MAG: metallophosphoesterase family protein [Thermodesulfobacteriota bacterium]